LKTFRHYTRHNSLLDSQFHPAYHSISRVMLTSVTQYNNIVQKRENHRR